MFLSRAIIIRRRRMNLSCSPLYGYLNKRPFSSCYRWLDIPYVEEFASSSPPLQQSLDIYMPKEPFPRPPSPVYVYFHGGSWQRGDKQREGACNLSESLALARNAIVVSVNYRLSPQVKHPTHVTDVTTALQWIVQHIRQYGGDANHLVLFGHSAGAHLLMYLLTQDKTRRSFLQHRIKAVVGIAGVYNVSRLAATPYLGSLCVTPAFGTESTSYEEASPYFRIRDTTCPSLTPPASRPLLLLTLPILLINATFDLHLQTDSEELAAILAHVGHDQVERVTIPNSNHLNILGSACIGATVEAISNFLTERQID